MNQVWGYSAHEMAWLIEETDHLCMDFLLAFKDPFIDHVNYSSKFANVLIKLVKCMQLEFILKAQRSSFSVCTYSYMFCKKIMEKMGLWFLFFSIVNYFMICKINNIPNDGHAYMLDT